jgi:hypothetical protein
MPPALGEIILGKLLCPFGKRFEVYGVQLERPLSLFNRNILLLRAGVTSTVIVLFAHTRWYLSGYEICCGI